ncbi:serine/threonine-protein kinase [Nocardiopsis sediminis]|uniref:non-specific serine/threonine protein kinase n=1 Tax=Nocardiopsis sediminis TaxID=1778267 RepID=A0ABV8FMJ7_9ACTN
MTPRLLAERYRLLEPIGRGGMGTVWRAEDEFLKRVVAVKEVRVPAELDSALRDELVARTLREARICAGLSGHPSIVTIHDVVLQDERPWIVMELMEGRSLDQAVEDDGPFTPGRAAEVGRQILSALETAHGAGVLHRDVKPGNVLLMPDGRAVLSDFGIAVSDSETKLTLTGRLPGSPGYIAPERLRSGETTAMADVWSLGATLFYAVEGRPAYDGATVAGLLAAVLEGDPHPPRRAGPLRPILHGMMQRDPRDRIGGKALAEELKRVASGTAGSGSSPTLLDAAHGLRDLGGTGVTKADGAKASDKKSADGGGNAGGRGADPNKGTSWWPPGRGNWVRLLMSAVTGLITLILAPLLVAYIVARWPPPSPPPIDYGGLTETPQGYTQHTVDGFSIVAHETWRPQDSDGGLLLSSPSEQAHILLRTVEADGAGPLELLERSNERLEGSDEFEETIHLDEVAHPDGEAALWTYQGMNGDMRMMAGVVSLERDDRIALAMFATPADEWEAADEERRNAFESFRPTG